MAQHGLLTFFFGMVVSSVSLADCKPYEGRWNCYFENGGKTEVSIVDSKPAELTQVKAGIKMGPLVLDNKKHSYMDSSRVEMNYLGVCGRDELYLTVEQIYMGGIKVRFDQKYKKLSSGEMKLQLIDYKPNKPPLEKRAACFK